MTYKIPDNLPTDSVNINSNYSDRNSREKRPDSDQTAAKWGSLIRVCTVCNDQPVPFGHIIFTLRTVIDR